MQLLSEAVRVNESLGINILFEDEIEFEGVVTLIESGKWLTESLDILKFTAIFFSFFVTKHYPLDQK